MQERNKLNRLLGVAALAMLFGGTSVYAQSTAPDASGMTKENKAGKMSPTGQNETSSAKPSSSAPSSSASSSSDKASSSSSGASGTSGQAASGSSASDTSSSASKSASGASLSKADQNLMRDIAYSNLAEIEAAKVAQNKTKSDQVKTFAQKMIDDHTQAQKDLEQLAQSKGVTLPTEPDRKHQAELKKLSALEGDKFDKQYMSKGGVGDHRKTDNMLKKAEQRAKDPDLKALVAKIKPTVDEHLTMAKDISSGKSTASGSSGKSGTSSSGAGSSESKDKSKPSDTSGSSSTSGMEKK
ncbi:DUF4142 domain-containing protein [Noviherbaspirillum sp.]|uniref:DUF4142 domain-containing protein n=1 Tax=Noviherbaspirillum sp. TaxID=1926288 RepID=UPI002B47DB6C|nr:DUF4142 domain-containing protein [Noviherbaspirillum sp.]HJV79800.1 DUF4142 domain-containing protein [Noviherbaspirillum sp.]